MSAVETKKKETTELLKITKVVRAKSIDDEYGRVYQAGEEGRFKGTAKLELLARGFATRDLKAEIEGEVDLSKMSVAQLDEYGLTLGVDLTTYNTRSKKLNAIKKSLK